MAEPTLAEKHAALQKAIEDATAVCRAEIHDAVAPILKRFNRETGAHIDGIEFSMLPHYNGGGIDDVVIINVTLTTTIDL